MQVPGSPEKSASISAIARRGTAALLLAGLVGCASPPPSASDQVPELIKGSGIPAGYLAAGQWPDSARLLPAPPAKGSVAEAADLEAHRSLDALRTGPRWQQAKDDAELLDIQRALHSFGCALGVAIDSTSTPHLAMLLRRSGVDAGMATLAAKQRHQRQRPFAALGERSCTPESEAGMAKDGSYPSGHAAIGWAWGLVLASVAPERAGALFARGHDYGVSRMVCAVHWKSDIEAGRDVAAATVARLGADPVFARQRELAIEEVRRARAERRAPPARCPSAPS